MKAHIYTSNGKEFILSDEQGSEPPLPELKVQELSAMSLRDTGIKSEPTSNGKILKTVYEGTRVKIWDYFLPDIDFPIYGSKWYPLSRGDGWIMKEDFSIPIPVTVFARIEFEHTQQISFTNGTTVEKPLPMNFVTVPNEGTFYRVGHDFETIEWDYKPRSLGKTPSPETCPTLNKPEFVELGRQWQERWFELMQYVSYGVMTKGELLTAWADITSERKALTDNHGLAHRYTDYILDLYNPSDTGRRISQKSLLMGGNLLKVNRIEGRNAIFECLDATKPPPPLSYILERPYLWGWATESTSIQLSQTTWVVSKWPNFKNFSGNGVPFLVRGIGTENSVRHNRLIPMQNGEKYSPYLP